MPLNRIGAGGPFLVSPALGDGPVTRSSSFVSNANAPQLVNYALVAGLGFFCASAVTPQGQANASEYRFGTHAQAIHQAEAIKSSVWGSVRTPPAAPTSASLRPFFAAPEQVDLSISGWVVGGTQANQGPVPAPFLTLPQDPTQLTAQIWKSQPAAVVATPNPVATFFSVPPQSEDRQTRAVWQSLRAGQTPPVIASFYAAPQQADLTQQGVIAASARTPPAIGPIPPRTVGAPQADPSQLAPQIWQSVQTPPAITGVTVWPNIIVPAQFDTSVNATVLWTPSTFSPSAVTPPSAGGAPGMLLTEAGRKPPKERAQRQLVISKRYVESILGEDADEEAFVESVVAQIVEAEKPAQPELSREIGLLSALDAVTRAYNIHFDSVAAARSALDARLLELEDDDLMAVLMILAMADEP